MQISFNLLLIILILIGNISQSLCQQTTIDYVPLKSFNPNDDFSDLASLDKYFSESKVVGMGESTHGTHEFFQNRHRMFRYLVENHGFNVFLLEADYSNCLRVNRYINGEKDNLREVVNSIDLWPWITEEMASLIEWMRNYNSLPQNKNKLQFIGCDMQKLNATIYEIDKLIAKYDATLIDSSGYLKLTDIEFSMLSDVEIIQKYKSITLNKKEVLKRIEFEPNDMFVYETLIRHLGQIVEAPEKIKFVSYRDLKMGENILYYLSNNPDAKGLFWAHNGHIANIYNHKKKDKKLFCKAGGVIKKELKDKYLIIGQDFDKGTFNAYHIPNYVKGMKVDLGDVNNYVLGPVTVTLNERDLSYQFRDVSASIFYIIPSTINKKQSWNLFLHDAGGSYIPSSSKKRPSTMVVAEDTFDIIVLIKNTTETKLIR